MNVAEAQQEIQNITKTINTINKLTRINASNGQLDVMIGRTDVTEPDLVAWNALAVHVVNGLSAYRSILRNAIQNAEIKMPRCEEDV